MQIEKRNIRAWSMMGPTGVFGVAMNELAKCYPDFNVVTADLCTFSGLERFSKEYPERFFNVGIAEQNMVGTAAGMAKEGINTFAATYASFATTRALDQVRVCMGYMGIPVKLVGLTSGFASGILGATHMALEDIAIMRSIPNMVVLSPADCLEAVKCFEAALLCDAPVYIRLTGTARMPVVYNEDFEFNIGTNICLKEGDDVCIFATGSMVDCAIQVADELESMDIYAKVYDVHTIKPFEHKIIIDNLKAKLFVTIEEHSIIGGLGDIIAGEIATMSSHPKLLKIGVEDFYPHAASYDGLLKEVGLSKDVITKKIRDEVTN